MRGNLFFIAVAAFAVGIIYQTFASPAWFAFFFLLLVSVLGIGAWFLMEQYAGAALCVVGVCVMFGMWRTSLVRTQLPAAFRPLLDTNVDLQGVIVADPDIRETSDRVTIQITKDTQRTKVIAVAPLYPTFSIGEQVAVSGKFVAPQPFATDGGRTFRYDQFLAKDGVFALIQQATIKETGPPQGIVMQSLHLLLAIKGAFIGALQKALPEPYVSLAVGVIVGGKQGLGPTLLDDFTIAGLLQIVVLSGYNVMIVAEVILKALGRLPKLIGLGIAALCIALFVIAAGAGSSAVRAGIMAMIALTAQGTQSTYNVARALTFSLLLMLLVNPLLLVYDPGLQLSFLATLGLIIGSPIIERWFVWVKSAFLREALATTCAAQIAVLPLLLYQSGNLSLVSLPANVLTMSAVPPAMALSALAAVIALIIPALAPLAGLPAFACLWYIIEVAKIAAHLPFAQIILPAFPAWIMAAAYALLAALVMRLRSQSVSLPSASSRYQGTPQRTGS